MNIVGEKMIRHLLKLSIVIPLLSISLFSAASTSCSYEYFNQGHGLDEHVMREGYNAPACIDLDAGFDLFIKGSCLYWCVLEQGLELGYLNSNNKIKFYDPDFDYHLGAKATAGGHLPHDNWNFYFTYLYYRNKKESLHIANSNFIDFWYQDQIIGQDKYENISSCWKLKLDIMDTYFSRPFYLGRKLTFEPLIGARGGWIKQKYNIPATPTSLLLIMKELENKSRSNSWVLGALFGLNSNWILIDFFRIYANFSCALMYQKFKVSNVQKILLDSVPLSSISLHHKIQNIVPSFDATLGLGWGTYFYNKRLHIDFTFGYDFSIFWNQNAISYVVGGLLKKIPSAALNNLVLHGISGAMRLDF